MGTLRPALQCDRSRPIPDRRDERAALSRGRGGTCTRKPIRWAATRCTNSPTLRYSDGPRGRMDQWPDHRHRCGGHQAHGGNFYGALKDMGDEQWEAMMIKGTNARDKADRSTYRVANPLPQVGLRHVCDKHRRLLAARARRAERAVRTLALETRGEMALLGGLNSRPHPYQGCALPPSHSSTVPPCAKPLGWRRALMADAAHKSTFA